MKCPICTFDVEQGLRCPQCGRALTIWKNMDAYASQAFRQGMQRHREGSQTHAIELISRAAMLAPEVPLYLYAYGCVLAQMQRYEEAKSVLNRAVSLSSDERIDAAIRKVEELTIDSESLLIEDTD